MEEFSVIVSLRLLVVNLLLPWRHCPSTPPAYSQTQVVYDGHKHSVLSLDVDSTGNIAATGEGSRNPELHLWDARSAQHILTVRKRTE